MSRILRSPVESHHNGPVMSLIFSVLSILVRCKTSSQVPSDLRCRDAHVSVILFDKSDSFTPVYHIRLTHWGRVTHLCVDELTITGSDNGFAPIHHMNQYCNIVIWTLTNKLRWNLNGNSYIFSEEDAFENVVRKIATILSWPQCN